MKLRARDQIHISSVQADSIRPGQEFEVSDAAGSELLKAHPTRLERVGAPAAKAEPTPKNKAEPKPANKTAG
jgi:hypothetical protein